MGYLREFQIQVANQNLPAFLRLWEEYCHSEELDEEELLQILQAVKNSPLAEPLGKSIEQILPLWKSKWKQAESSESLPVDSPLQHEILKAVFDIQTTNTPSLWQLAMDYLTHKYKSHTYFNEKIRLVGLRNKVNFQGAISNYELLTHLDKGKYVFHTGGWGVGEIMDLSLIREQLSVEFDYAPGRKELSFETAFKSLLPLPDDHFLALRFGNPDLLEKQAKENPVEVVRLLLRDLGPKTASEIKDELYDLVIPGEEWSRWWQSAKVKLKKDSTIEAPEDLKKAFRLTQGEVTREEKLQKALENKPDTNTLIQMVYSFLRDYPETLKNTAFNEALQAKLTEFLATQALHPAHHIALHFFLQDLKGEKKYPPLHEKIEALKTVKEVLAKLEIQALRKRLLTEVRKIRSDWKELFLELFLHVEQNTLRDYIFQELLPENPSALRAQLEELCAHPSRNPEAFVWYFQKIVAQDTLPFADQEGRGRFFEAFFVLLHHIEDQVEYKDLVRKMHALLSGGRYAIVRQIMQNAPIDQVKEFLLLASKCHYLGDHEIKTLHSLAEVVHPSLAKTSKRKDKEKKGATTLWITEEGYQKLKKRIEQVATVETVDNAKEIEVARAHGDLRENAEFKSALERRDRLQAELKMLSEQMNQAHLLTKEEVSIEEVGVGTIVDCVNKQGQKVSYTLLGPWEANPEEHILSFQSKLAQTMQGLSVQDKFQFQEEEFTITGIRSYFK